MKPKIFGEKMQIQKINTSNKIFKPLLPLMIATTSIMGTVNLKAQNDLERTPTVEMLEKHIINQDKTIDSLKTEIVKLKSPKDYSEETIINNNNKLKDYNQKGGKLVEELLMGMLLPVAGALILVALVEGSEKRKK